MSTGPSTGRSTPAWRVVAGRELSTQLRSKGFVIQSVLLLVGLVASIVILQLVSGGEQTGTVAVVDDTGASAVDQGSRLAQATDPDQRLESRSYESSDAAEAAVRDGDVDAALLPAGPDPDAGYELLGDDEVDPTLARAVGTALTEAVIGANAADQGVDLEALGAGSGVQQRLLDPEADDAGVRQAASFVFVLLFYVTALVFGLALATSVTQEKESRIVEILAAAVPIRAQLWGKIAGTSVLAIGQTLALAAAGVIGLLVTGDGDTLAVLGPAIAWYVVFFMLGFVALASLWSVAGALASRSQDVQAATTPLQIVLFVPYILSFTAGESVRTVLSMLPVVSTMLMPSRLATGDVPAWQLAVAIVLTVAAAAVFVVVGARVYERNLLRTGKRIGFREALRASADG